MQKLTPIARSLGTHTRILAICTKSRSVKISSKPKNVPKTELNERSRHEREHERRDDDAKVIITAYGLFAAYFMLLK